MTNVIKKSLPHGTVAFVSIKDATVQSVVMQLNENVRSLKSQLEAAQSAIIELQHRTGGDGGEPSDYSTVRSNAAAGKAHSEIVSGNPHGTTYQNLGGTKPSYTAEEVGAMPDTTTHLSGDVPTSRTVNGKALGSDITLTASDVGALPDTTTHLSGDVQNVSGASGIAVQASAGSEAGVIYFVTGS